MKPADRIPVKTAIWWTVIYFVIIWLVLPCLFNRWTGPDSMLRFDPQVSKDYNCIFVEGHARPGLAISWLRRSTPVDYLRIRYTPNAEKQAYGILFIDPKTLAYAGHAGCSCEPTNMAGVLDSPDLIRGWMESQPNSTQTFSHRADAMEIYNSIIALRGKDLEHFTLPPDMRLVQFRIGHRSLAGKALPSLSIGALMLVPLWMRVLVPRHRGN